MSCTITSNLAHRAAVHCGAVRLVGSVLTRDLYSVGEGVESALSISGPSVWTLGAHLWTRFLWKFWKDQMQFVFGRQQLVTAPI